MDENYDFHWERGSQHPYFISPKGKKIVCHVDQYCPYVIETWESPAVAGVPSEEPAPPTPDAGSAEADAAPTPGSSGGDAAPPIPRPKPPRAPRPKPHELTTYEKKHSPTDYLDPLSRDHLMTHKHKLDGCPICQRTRMQKKAHRRRGIDFGPKPDKFGKQCTADHIVSHSEESKGWDGAEYCVATYDRGTKW